eukprot:1152118-Pelagomonas_calceolata.AAC.7
MSKRYSSSRQVFQGHGSLDRALLIRDSKNVLLRDQEGFSGDLAAAVSNEVKGDAKFRAYLHLLAGVINMKVRLSLC